jgi:hypothetical protein
MQQKLPLFFLYILFFILSTVYRLNAQDKNDALRIKDYGLKKYTYLSKQLPHSENKAWKLVCQMPYNCQFQQWIRVKGPEGKVINLNSSNPLVQYLTKTENIITRRDVNVYEAENWVSGEGAIYTIPSGVTVEAVQYRETGYDTKFAGSFVCDDNDYNVLWKKSARTAYICMRDHFYDCPDRERVGFWGDGTPEMNQCFYAFDTASHALCKDLVLKPLLAGFYPGQQLEFLGEYGLWFYYMQTGDLQSIRDVYDSSKNFLLNTYKFGKKNQWFDWGKNSKDVAVIESCFMYIDLKTLKKIALLTGHLEDTTIINSRIDEIKAAFNIKYWKGNYYKSEQVSSPDDRANAMAVNAGLADSSKWHSIYNTVLTKYANSSCFFDRWVFEALCKMGKQEYALLRMYGRYKTMIPCSFSTLWEHYDRWWASGKDAFDDGSSLNHGWNPPVLLLSQTIAGVSPEEPGWSTFHVFPKEAFLKSIKVVVPSVKGEIKVEMQKSATRYVLKVVSPVNTKAIVGIPKGSFSTLESIKVNNTIIWNGVYFDNVKGVSFAGEDADYIKFKVVSGTWTFKASGILRITTPKPASFTTLNEIKLDKRSWTAKASVKDSSFLFGGDAEISVEAFAANSIDGDHWTGWRDMSRTQYPEQWLMIDMKQKQKFDKIVLDNTWALWDAPNKYMVTVSNDGKDWSDPVAQGAGALGITTISFPVQNARFIKISQTGSDSMYHWSVYEIDVCRNL